MPTHKLKLSRRAQKHTTAQETLAAIQIQRAWRRRKRSDYLPPDVLWTDAATHARLKVGRDAADEGKNAHRERWHRATFLASRLQDGDAVISGTDTKDVDAARKHLETQHWLELVDGKHRYGSNRELYYHRRWQQEDTSENFFKWLDRGAGKDLSLDECPRVQLERQRITYLSIEQRLNYLVQIDNEGKLRWVRNGELVDTTPGRWKDAGGGRGIVPADDPDASDEPEAPPLPHRDSFGDQADFDARLSTQEDAALHYAGFDRTKNRAWKNHFTAHGLLERLLRRTLRRNTWIYVSDKNFNLFIGIKDTGSFQHSSFLSGGLVTSAGLISVHEGLIHTLSPLSGHYRTSIQHFRRFLAALEERGVDMHKVEINKAEAALWGIERLAKFKSKRSELMKASEDELRAVRQAMLGLAHPGEELRAWKKEILEGRKHGSNPMVTEKASPEARAGEPEAPSYSDRLRGTARDGNGQHEATGHLSVREEAEKPARRSSCGAAFDTLRCTSSGNISSM